MPVVSNTSPLLNLSIIGRLDLVRQQFGPVLIPTAVRDELQIDSGRPGSDALQEAIQDGWIDVQDVYEPAHVRTLQRTLDRGEAEAIALAVSVDASRILLDERAGRRHARALDLFPTGAIGILLRAYNEGELPSLRSALDALENEAGFWIAPSLRKRVLRASNQ